MLNVTDLVPAPSDLPEPFTDRLVAMLGLLGLRIFEATSADIADLGEEHGHPNYILAAYMASGT